MGELARGGEEARGPSTAWRVAIGCAIALALGGMVAVIGCALTVRWMRERAPVDRELAVLTGEETGYASVFLTGEDPGIAAFGRKLVEVLGRMNQPEGGPARPRLGLGQEADWMLPLRLQLRAYPPQDGADPADPAAISPDVVVEVEVAGGHRFLASMLRFASWVAPDEQLGRERIPSGSLYQFREEPGGPLRFLGISGNRFVLGDSRERLVALLTHPPAPIALPAGLEGVREAVALPGEDLLGWWADPAGGGSLGLPYLTFAVASGDLTDDDRMDLCAAFGLPRWADEAEADRTIRDWMASLVPEEPLRLEVVGAPEWIGAHTVRYRLRLTGLAEGLEEWLREHRGQGDSSPRDTSATRNYPGSSR